MTDYIEYTPKRHGQRPPYWTPDTPTGLDNKNFVRQPNWAWIAGTVYYVPYEAVHGHPRPAMDELIAQDADLTDICPNCEAQANTIEELRAANERWVIAFKQAEERAIEQHEAYKQDVSDAVEMISNTSVSDNVWRTWAEGILKEFIISKPTVDPLVEAMADCGVDRFESWADQLRAALEARGLEIREKSDD